MKINLPIYSRLSRYRQTITVATGLLILLMLHLVLGACIPQDSEALPPAASTSHTATPLTSAATRSLNPSDPITKPTLKPDATLPLRTPPVIISTNTPGDNQMTPTTSPSPNPLDSSENKLLVYAKEDLAERLGIPIEEIELISMEAVTWPDGSLGCPKPGVEYTQVQREGALIRLRAEKHFYQYHSGGGRPPFLCEHPSVDMDLPPPSGLGNE